LSEIPTCTTRQTILMNLRSTCRFCPSYFEKNRQLIFTLLRSERYNTLKMTPKTAFTLLCLALVAMANVEGFGFSLSQLSQKMKAGSIGSSATRTTTIGMTSLETVLTKDRSVLGLQGDAEEGFKFGHEDNTVDVIRNTMVRLAYERSLERMDELSTLTQTTASSSNP